jgi:DNA-binding HxlR family transcriptional regulator
LDIYSIPEVFESRIRLAVLSALITGEKNFNELKELTKATDGNLSVHLAKLEAADYIISKKEFIGKKPRTTYGLTDAGREGFLGYVKLLEETLRDS